MAKTKEIKGNPVTPTPPVDKGEESGKQAKPARKAKRQDELFVQDKKPGIYEPADGAGLGQTFNETSFESELITAGKSIIDSVSKAIYPDKRRLLIDCRYLGYLERIGRPDKIRLALVVINGTMAIKGRARNDAIQAHGGLYFPPDTPKEERKELVEMQSQQKRGNGRRDGGNGDSRDRD